VNQTRWAWYQRICTETDWRIWNLDVCLPWNCCKSIYFMTTALIMGPTKSRPDAARSRPDVSRAPFGRRLDHLLRCGATFCNLQSYKFLHNVKWHYFSHFPCLSCTWQNWGTEQVVSMQFVCDLFLCERWTVELRAVSGRLRAASGWLRTAFSRTVNYAVCIQRW